MTRAWLLLRKDLLVLRRSPLLLGVLLAYPLVIAALVGLVASYANAKPRVALVDERAVGYAIYAPPAFLPGAAAFPTSPPRRTRAWGTCSDARASTLAAALSCWLVPMTTLNVTRAATTTPVGAWPIEKLATATMISMMFIGFESWLQATVRRLGGGSVWSSLGP